MSIARRRVALAAALSSLALLPAAPAVAADAPANVQGDPAHTGAVPAGALTGALGKRWVRTDLGEAFGPPVVAEGKVFVVGGPRSSSSSTSSPEQRRLYALDAGSGATLWSEPATNTGVAYGDGKVYRVVGDEIVEARSAATGAVAWTRRLDDSDGLLAEVVAAPGEVYVTGDAVHALDAADGSVRWRRSPSGASPGPVAVVGDRVYTTGCGAGTAAFERTLGLKVWEHSGGCTGGPGQRPVVGGGRVYATSNSEGVVLDQDDGSMVGALLPPAPALAGGRSFQVRGTDVIAREAAGDRPLWQRSFPQLVLSQPLVIGDAVVVRVGTGDLVALDAASGAERWRSATRVTAYSGGERTFLAARADRLVVPYPEKLIGYGAGPDTPGVDPDPWRAPSAVSLEMELPRGTRRRIFGRPHEVHGRFERNEGQEEHRVVELQADPWPFDGAWQTVQTMASDTISTTHRPDRNTRLRLHYGGVDPAKVTEPVTSWVELAIGVRYRSLSRTRLRARTTLRGPADALARPTTMHFYFFRAATGRATRLRSVRLRRSGDALRGTVVLRVPQRFGRRDSVFPCYREKTPDAWGKPVRSLRHCGRPRL